MTPAARPLSALSLRAYYLVSFAALGAYVPYFPAWLEAQGMHGLEMSSITSLMPFVGLLSPVLFGMTADALGLRGSLLRVAIGGALVPFVFLAGSAWLGVALGYRAVFATVAVFAFFRTPMVLIADVSALEAGSGYGAMRLFGSLGFLVMAVATGSFIDPTQRSALPTAIAVAFAATLAVSFALPSRVERAPAPIVRDAARLIRNTEFLAFLAVAFLWCAAHVAYDLCFSLHVRDLGGSPRVVGAYWGIGVASEIALMAVAHRVVVASAPVRLFPLGLAVVAVRFVMIAKVHSLAVMGFLQPLHAITFALMWVSCVEFVRASAPPHVLATAQSLFSMATGLGAGTGMLVWGPMYASGGGPLVFATAAEVAVLGGGAALVLAARTRRAAPLSTTR